MDLVLYPHQALRRIAREIPLGLVKKDYFRRKTSTLFRIMYRRSGVGFAGPQMGWNYRVIAINRDGSRATHDEKAFMLINPQIQPFGNEVYSLEGCLSLPGIYAPVKRHEKVRVKTLDVEGKEREFQVGGFVSRIIQHEYDHLEGIIFIDRLEKNHLRQIQPALDAHIFRVDALRKQRQEEYERLKAEFEKEQSERLEKRRKEYKKIREKFKRTAKKKEKKGVEYWDNMWYNLISDMSDEYFENMLRKHEKEEEN